MKIHQLTLGAVATHCYIVGDEATRDCVIIDPSDDAPLILKTIAGAGWTLREIWITHAHFDHILALHDLKAAQNVPVRMHPADLPILRSLPDRMEQIFGKRAPMPPTPEIDLAAGDALTVGGEPFEVRFTPGHAPGHVIFVNHAHKTAISGDCVFFDSIGRTDLPGANHEQLMHSITEQILTLPDDYALLPGHGERTSVGRERTHNPYIVDWLDR